MPLYTWLSTQEGKKKPQLNEEEPEKGEAGQSMTWLHCALGGTIDIGEDNDERLQVRPQLFTQLRVPTLWTGGSIATCERFR